MTIILSLTMHRGSSLTVLLPPSRGSDCNYLFAILEPSLEWLIVFPCLAHSSHLLGLKVNSPFPSFGLVLLCSNRRLSIFICTITFIPWKYYFICLSVFLTTYNTSSLWEAHICNLISYNAPPLTRLFQPQWPSFCSMNKPIWPHFSAFPLPIPVSSLIFRTLALSVLQVLA